MIRDQSILEVDEVSKLRAIKKGELNLSKAEQSHLNPYPTYTAATLQKKTKSKLKF